MVFVTEGDELLPPTSSARAPLLPSPTPPPFVPSSLLLRLLMPVDSLLELHPRPRGFLAAGLPGFALTA